MNKRICYQNTQDLSNIPNNSIINEKWQKKLVKNCKGIILRFRLMINKKSFERTGADWFIEKMGSESL